MIAGAALWRMERGKIGPLSTEVDPGLALG
jgi:hypothetical protein